MESTRIITPDIVYGLYGSHLYGLNNANSDEDWKGVFLPSKDELLLNNYPRTIKSSTGDQHSKNGAGDEDLEYISLPRLVELGCRSDTMAIDMLHMPYIPHGLVNPRYKEIWDSLVENRTRFYSRNMSSLVGYLKHQAANQAAKYGVKGSRMSSLKLAIEVLEIHIRESGSDSKLTNCIDMMHLDDNCKLITIVNEKANPPHESQYYEVMGKKYQESNTLKYVYDALTKWYDSYGHRARLAEKNEGVDWKALSHALRAGYQVIDIFEQGDFEYPLRQNAYLQDVKEGKLDFKTNVQLELEVVTDRAMQLSQISTLPEEVDQKFWDDWLLAIYEEFVL